MTTQQAQGVAFTVRVDGVETVNNVLALLRARGENLAKPLGEIGAMMLTSTQRRFETETDPDGRRWKLLSAETVLDRIGGRAKAHTKTGSLRKPAARKVGAIAILRQSARLFQSLTYRVGRGYVEIGTNAIYGRIHQLGGQAGRGKKVTIPARPYLGANTADRQGALEIVNRYLAGAS